MDDLVERLHGPVQWGYMCLTDGGFIADDTPVEAAARIEKLEAALREVHAQTHSLTGSMGRIGAICHRALTSTTKGLSTGGEA